MKGFRVCKGSGLIGKVVEKKNHRNGRKKGIAPDWRGEGGNTKPKKNGDAFGSALVWLTNCLSRSEGAGLLQQTLKNSVSGVDGEGA